MTNNVFIVRNPRKNTSNLFWKNSVLPFRKRTISWCFCPCWFRIMARGHHGCIGEFATALGHHSPPQIVTGFTDVVIGAKLANGLLGPCLAGEQRTPTAFELRVAVNSPDAARRMAKRSVLERTLRWSAATGLFVLGGFLLLLGPTAVTDHAALKRANALIPLDVYAFATCFCDREELLAPGVVAHARALQFVGRPQPPPGEGPRLALSMGTHGATPGWGEGVFLFGVPIGVGLLCGGFGLVAGWRPLGRLTILGGPVFFPYGAVILIPTRFFHPLPVSAPGR